MIDINEYSKYVDKKIIDDILLLAKSLEGLRVLHINSTHEGGGVAEILSRLVPLMNSLDIKTDWAVFKGNQQFFKFTKKLHNMLHLPNYDKIDSNEVLIYLGTTYENVNNLDTDNYDVIFVHDPQPLGMVMKKKDKQKWIWRCHIDTSTPTEKAWEFIELFVNAYDCAIFHMPDFVHSKLNIPVYIIPPSIDPIHPKNIELEKDFIFNTLEKLKINPDKPIILQVSRFDRLKDPMGVYKAYKLVKKNYDCQLVLAGSFASDDPEGIEVYNQLLDDTQDDKDVLVLNLPPDSHLEINALQRVSAVVIQKSIREGFGLVVSEAMWKNKAVIGGNVGGIKKQIVNNHTGFLVDTIEEAAYKIEELLTNEELRERMGKLAKQRVRELFLITRHLKDYLTVIKNQLGK